MKSDKRTCDDMKSVCGCHVIENKTQTKLVDV